MNKNMASKNNNLRIQKKYICMALIVCVLMLISSVSGFAFSKMQTSDGGSDSGRVARNIMNACAISSGTSLKINCNDMGQNLVATYVFSVSNNDNESVSELDTSYNVIVTLDTKLPEGISASIDNVPGTVSANGKKITFSNDAWVTQALVATTNTHVLTFTADPTIVTQDANIKIAVKIHMEQIN